ncbi:MAG: DNA repair protein RecO [Desulfococcus sp. 4484_241]|nr:MAG: DNA repair protein RecO [Desulfococcus sp. 4484_241]
MSTFTSRAIILKRITYLDYDLIIDFLTYEKGKVSAIAKNALKSKKRFAGILEPFVCLDAVFAGPGRKNGMPVLKEALVKNPFAGIRLDIKKTAYAAYWSEMVNRWMEEDGTGSMPVFQLLYHVLDGLDRAGIAQETLHILFQVRFMTLAGMAPRLDSCGICKKKIDQLAGPELYFDVAKGGIVCHTCGLDGYHSNRTAFSKGTVKQLLWMQTSQLEKAARVQLSGAARNGCKKALEAFVLYHLSSELKSLDVLRSICGRVKGGA